MPRLRMKDTPEDIAAILKSERRARRKRRREEERTRPRDDSMTPPRASTSYLGLDDMGYDESSLPPSQARKTERYEEDFDEKLRNAFEEDHGVGRREEEMYNASSSMSGYRRRRDEVSASFAYGGAAGIALGMGKTGLDRLDEDEYAEHLRAGMWRLKNKDEAERIEALEREKKIKEEKERVEDEKRRRVEGEKIRKLEEKVRQRGVKEEKDARERYATLWKKILDVPKTAPAPPVVEPPADDAEAGPQLPTPHPYPLRFTDFPWPLYPSVVFPPLSWPAPSDITPSAISTFLLSPVPRADRKSTLRSAVLAYHPDRFDRLLARIPPEKEDVHDRVKELGLRVSQVLNDLLKAAGSA